MFIISIICENISQSLKYLVFWTSNITKRKLFWFLYYINDFYYYQLIILFEHYIKNYIVQLEKDNFKLKS